MKPDITLLKAATPPVAGDKVASIYKTIVVLTFDVTQDSRTDSNASLL